MPIGQKYLADRFIDSMAFRSELSIRFRIRLLTDAWDNNSRGTV